jgi:hypothetical protein
MIYVDDYNSKVINNSPPSKKDKEEVVKAKQEMDSKQLAIFWYIAGVTIANKFEDVKSLLSEFGYQVSDEEDAASAIADMIGTKKWAKFVMDFGEIIEDTIDDRIEAEDTSEESGFVAALIAAIGATVGGTLGLIKTSKEKQVAKENAKTQMFTGITAVLVEKEKVKAAKEAALAQERKGIVAIIISLIIVVGIIIGIIIYKRNKAAKI